MTGLRLTLVPLPPETEPASGFVPRIDVGEHRGLGIDCDGQLQGGVAFLFLHRSAIDPPGGTAVGVAGQALQNSRPSPVRWSAMAAGIIHQIPHSASEFKFRGNSARWACLKEPLYNPSADGHGSRARAPALITPPVYAAFGNASRISGSTLEFRLKEDTGRARRGQQRGGRAAHPPN